MSSLESAPNEIIQEIAFRVALVSFLGPPASLPAFLCLSKRIYAITNRKNNPQLYARIFCSKFDIHAVRRRLSNVDLDQADELVHRCRGLTRIRLDAYPRYPSSDDDGGLRDDLWMAYIMFLESDGHNALQLIQYAHVDCFARKFIRTGGRLHDGAQYNDGWIVDNEINALGMWLFWLTDNGSAHLLVGSRVAHHFAL